MKDHRSSEIRVSFQFLFPLLLFVSTFILVPVIGTMIGSTYLDVSFLQNGFIGLDNYRWMINNPGFWGSVRFTFLFVLVSVPLEMTLGLMFALLLNEPTRMRGLLRACVLIPWAIPAAVSARAWELIYNYHYGLANFVWSGLGFTEPINWLGTELGAFTAVVIADAWKTTPFIAIILLAGISAIPEDLYRQAQVDGASLFQRFTRITLPLIKPAIIVALIFRTIDALRIFDIIYVLTHGGPGGATTSLSLYAYNYFLIGDFGYGSAVSVFLFTIAFLMSIAYVKIGRFGEEIL
jgi:multiple sugar transport system permease protein